MTEDTCRPTTASRRTILTLAGGTGVAALAGCLGGGGGGGGGGSGVSEISGAGSSFVDPLMQKWAQVYQQDQGLQVRYRSIGSGGGQNNLIDKTIQFAGSDAPLTTEQYNQLQGEGGVVHVPESMGAIVPVFNVKGVDSLRLTGPVLAQVFLGNVTRWDDPAIADLNPDVSLPGEDIVVAHRSDASGTSYGFTDYLSIVSDEWDSKIGTSKSPSWPTGVGGKGNEGVSSVMQKQSNAIGYVELTYATNNDLDAATMRNKDGKWVDPSLDGVSAAAAGVVDNLPKGTADWSSVSINNAPGAGTWPISTLTYLIMYQDMGQAFGGDVSQAKAQAVVDFARWAVTDGQQYAPDLQYPALPDAVVSLDRETLNGMNYNGSPLTSG